jgi:CheY-like chemotaxis protein
MVNGLRTPDGKPRPVVLVVDDDPAVRAVLSRRLTRLGYAVLLAAGGVEQYQPNCGSVEFVLVDVRMPDVDGPTTLTAMRPLDPDVACYFMAGDPGRWTEADLMDTGAQAVLAKPFTADELQNVLPPVPPVTWAAPSSGHSASRRDNQ